MNFTKYLNGATLSIKNIHLTDQNIQDLLNFLRDNLNIKLLDLCNNKISNKGAKNLLESLHLANLAKFNLFDKAKEDNHLNKDKNEHDHRFLNDQNACKINYYKAEKGNAKAIVVQQAYRHYRANKLAEDDQKVNLNKDLEKNGKKHKQQLIIDEELTLIDEDKKDCNAKAVVIQQAYRNYRANKLVENNQEVNLNKDLEKNGRRHTKQLIIDEGLTFIDEDEKERNAKAMVIQQVYRNYRANKLAENGQQVNLNKDPEKNGRRHKEQLIIDKTLTLIDEDEKERNSKAIVIQQAYGDYRANKLAEDCQKVNLNKDLEKNGRRHKEQLIIDETLTFIDEDEKERNAKAIVIQQAYRDYRANKLAADDQEVNLNKDSEKNGKRHKEQLIIDETLTFIDEDEKERNAKAIVIQQVYRNYRPNKLAENGQKVNLNKDSEKNGRRHKEQLIINKALTLIDEDEKERNAKAIVIQQVYRDYRANKLAEDGQEVNVNKDSEKNGRRHKEQLIIDETLTFIDEDEKERNAKATVIQQAYRNYRAYKLAEDVQGINPYKDSERNILRLKAQLINGEGLSDLEKKSKGKSILTEEEIKLVDVILNKFQWTLKHATRYYDAIMKGGNQLLSVRERSRLAYKRQNVHASQYGGVDDNVFFTLGSPNHNIAGFVDTADVHVISVDLKMYMNNANKPQDIFKGLWYSDHWFPYVVNKRYGCKLYGKTTRVISHDKGDIYSNVPPTKTYYYTREDNTKLKRVVCLGDETVIGKDIVEFIALNLVLELRYISSTYRNKLLSNPILANIEPAIDTLFNSNVFEAKLPVKLPLASNAITVVLNSPHSSGIDKNAILMHAAAKTGDVAKIKNLLDQDINVDVKVDKETPLYATIDSSLNQENKLRCGKFLLDNNADASIVIYNDIFTSTPLGYAIFRSRYDQGCKDLIPFLIKSKVPHKRDADIKYVVDFNETKLINTVKYLIENNLETFNLLRDHGLEITKTDAPEFMGKTITGLYYVRNHHLSEEPYLKLINLLCQFGPNISTTSYTEQKAFSTNITSPLIQAVKLGLTDIIGVLAKNGANLNHHLYDDEDSYKNCGKTALLFAVENKKIDVVKTLVQLGANIEEQDDFGRSAYYLSINYSEQTYNEYKNNKTKQQFQEDVHKYKEIADYLKFQGAKKISKTQVLDYFNKRLIVRSVVMATHNGSKQYLMGKKIEILEFDTKSATPKEYSFPVGICENGSDDVRAIAKKGVFQNTLIHLDKFAKYTIKELHHYDRITTGLNLDKFNEFKKLYSNKGQTRNIDTTILFDVDDIKKVRFNSVENFVNIRWIDEKDIANVSIIPSDALLLKKAMDPELNLKEEIDLALDFKYDGANQLINKLLLEDKNGVTELLDNGFNVNSLLEDPKINVVLQKVLKTLIEKYSNSVNNNCDSTTNNRA